MPRLAVSLASKDVSLAFPIMMVVQLGLAAFITSLISLSEYRRYGELEPLSSNRYRGPITLWVVGAAFGFVQAVYLALTGDMWGVTSAFVLWGSQVLKHVDGDVAEWRFWQQSSRAALLADPYGWLRSMESVVDLAVVLGVMGVSLILLQKRGREPRCIMQEPCSSGFASLVGAVSGGLLLGYGARLAYGCNIGGYFSSLAAFDLYGWFWLILSLPGQAIGIFLRPYVGLANETYETALDDLTELSLISH